MLPGLQLRRTLHSVVVAASNQRASKRGGKEKPAHRGGQTSSTSKSVSKPTPNSTLATLKADEHLLFQEIKPSFTSGNPLKILYAYPNEYTVGICSLGYQLVWAFFATQPDIDVMRMFTDAREQPPRAWGGRYVVIW